MSIDVLCKQLHNIQHNSRISSAVLSYAEMQRGSRRCVLTDLCTTQHVPDEILADIASASKTKACAQGTLVT